MLPGVCLVFDTTTSVLGLLLFLVDARNENHSAESFALFEP